MIEVHTLAEGFTKIQEVRAILGRAKAVRFEINGQSVDAGELKITEDNGVVTFLAGKAPKVKKPSK